MVPFTKQVTTPNHVLYSKHLTNPKVKIVVATGSSGSGKTLLASTNAVVDLLDKRVKRIVITRPQVTLDEQMGFIPGTIENKMMPWLLPIYDCFKEYITTQRLKEYVNNGEIEICPLAYLRGRTFHNSWIIADEVQNTTINQMKSLTTRIGQESRLVMTGDLDQCDMSGQNGLQDFIERYKRCKNAYEDFDVNVDEDPIRIVEFSLEDVKRSEIVRHVLDMYSI
jgi:phosphate starvation-inducible PhoH-like protein